MRFIEFKKSLCGSVTESVAGTYLFCGEDAYFRENGYAVLLEKFVTEPAINSVFPTPEELLSAEKLIGQLYVLPFLSRYRIVAVREFYPKADIIKALAAYFAKPAENTIFVIMNSGSSESLKKQNGVKFIDCSFESVPVLSSWVQATCKRSGVGITPSAARKVCEYTLSDMSRISTETEKLITYADGCEISDKDVDALVSKDSNYRMYELTDNLSKKNFDKTMEILRELTAKGNSEQLIYVSIFYHIRKLLHAAINSKKSNSELMEILSEKSDFRVKILKEQAGRFKTSSLKKAYDALVIGDYNAKNGTSALSNALYESVFRIMTE